MKEISELNFPENLKYSKEHEWVVSHGEALRIGISDYAQDQLGDVVFVELPEVGAHFDTEEVFGTVESVKAVSELFMPVAGEVLAINDQLEDSPELVNSDPYGAAWMVEIKPEDPGQIEALMDQPAYLAMLESA